MTHTPGPWGTEIADEVTYGGIRRAAWRIYSAGDMNVCFVTGNIAFEEANARLISAAPELLEELRLLVIQCSCGKNTETIDFNSNCGKCRMAKQAIAKAEGRL